ncbi:60S ribosomal protein L12-like [Otolemur garnettii]|uniref:60S ribosomal protein L12-like n=1 Tax=Otolemur garnettii TaxID=30611 RepID=UPI0006447821|nr:60S ribosomal protein L12-like [Otolemur garnettii]
MLPKFNPNDIKVMYMRCTGGEVGAMSALVPKIDPLGLSPKKVGDDIDKATSDRKVLKITVKLTIQNRQAQIEVVPSASVLIIKVLKEPLRDKKKQTNIKHNGNITFDEIVNIARQMRHRSLARELSRTIKEILGMAQLVGCNVDGCHPHNIIEDINSDVVEDPADGDAKMRISQDQLSSTRGPDRTVHISCKLSGVPLKDTIVHWYQQKEGEPPRRILYGSAKNYKQDIPNSRMETDEKDNGVFYLIINNVVKSDEATYYCACWDLTVPQSQEEPRSQEHITILEKEDRKWKGDLELKVEC